MTIPLIYLQFTLKGELGNPGKETSTTAGHHHNTKHANVKGSKIMLFLGIAGLVSVPLFKTVTHLPPYLGMLFALGILLDCIRNDQPSYGRDGKKNRIQRREL